MSRTTQTSPAPATKKKQVNLDTSTRYIRRFGGYHEKYWVDYDKKHVLGKLRLLDRVENRIAEVDLLNIKPLPKSTIAGFVISLAVEGKSEFIGF